MAAKSLANKLLSPTKILDKVVKDIIANESAIFPDLSSLIVLVPNSFACDSFNKLLAIKTGGSILMPNANDYFLLFINDRFELPMLKSLKLLLSEPSSTKSISIFSSLSPKYRCS